MPKISKRNGTTGKYRVIYWISTQFRRKFLIQGTPNRLILCSSFRSLSFRSHTLIRSSSFSFSFVQNFTMFAQTFNVCHSWCVCVCVSDLYDEVARIRIRACECDRATIAVTRTRSIEIDNLLNKGDFITQSFNPSGITIAHSARVIRCVY